MKAEFISQPSAPLLCPPAPAPAPRWAFTPSSIPTHPSVTHPGPRQGSLCVCCLSSRSSALPSGTLEVSQLPSLIFSLRADGGKDSLSVIQVQIPDTRSEGWRVVRCRRSSPWSSVLPAVPVSGSASMSFPERVGPCSPLAVGSSPDDGWSLGFPFFVSMAA